MWKRLEILIVLIIFFLQTLYLEKTHLPAYREQISLYGLLEMKASRGYEEYWKRSFQLRILNII